MVARYLASTVMAMALMPLPSGQLSNIVCTGMLQDRAGGRGLLRARPALLPRGTRFRDVAVVNKTSSYTHDGVSLGTDTHHVVGEAHKPRGP